MKKIINGKKYDTETAVLKGEADNGYPVNDFSYAKEGLYQKKTGEYFLYGVGGPKTRYATHHGNMWSGGEMIQPLTYDEARDWAEENLDADEYESIFGAVSEDETKAPLTLSLNASTIEKLKREASKQGISVSDLVSQLVEKGEQDV